MPQYIDDKGAVKVAENRVLIEVPIEYLWDGLILEEDVFNPEGTVLLIPKGERITEQKLERLSHFGTQDNCVATYEDSYRVIMQGAKASADLIRVAKENESGYTELKKNVENVIARSQRAARIERNEVENVIRDVVEKLQEKEQTAIFSCIHVPRPIDEALQRHLLNVGFLNGMMGQWLQLSENEIQTLVLVGVLHDIGKTKVPEEILNAPRKLTPEEYAVMKMHPVYSGSMLGSQFDDTIKDAIMHHHERMNGDGYPDRLKGEEIPLFSKITAISDVYDAMITERCYKQAVAPFEILERVKNAEFEGLDPVLVAFFVGNMLKYYRYKRVRMSDDTKAEILYIPPNDISHPVVSSRENAVQTTDEWYPVEVM